MSATRYGKYIVQQRLRDDGVVEVFLATDPTGKVFAVRQLLPKLKLNLFKRHKFIKGLRIQAQMRHPNILQVFELQAWKAIPYAVMEYVEGSNLRQAMTRGNEFLSREFIHQTLYIFERMVEVIGYVHKQGYMHLNFKPENILINHAGDIKLFDFDLARPIPKKPTILSVLNGTPSYLAPEQVLMLPMDERADIFSLGVTAFEMFTGEKPVPSQNQEDALRIYKELDAPFRPANKVNADLPQILNHIIMCCLEKRMNRRYPSASMIMKDILKAKNSPGELK